MKVTKAVSQRILTVSTTSAQTGANTNETDLWTYSLPANTLSADGYAVRITTLLTSASNANNKRVRLYFGGSLIADTGATGGNNSLYGVDGLVVRTGASAQIGQGLHIIEGILNTTTSPFRTTAVDTTAAITIKVTGQNGTASAGDIVFRCAIVEFLRAGA